MLEKTLRLKNIILNNPKVVTNYFFMTVLQVFSSAFGILIYPYLIRTLGSEAYGSYIFALAIVNYFIDFIGFGFQLTGLQLIEENKSNPSKKSTILSTILSAKLYLAIISALIFIPSIWLSSNSNTNLVLAYIVFSQILAEVIYPQWYFRALQKTKIVTYIQLSSRIASLPFIFILINEPTDIIKYACISSISVILPAIILLFYIIKNDTLHIKLVSIKKCTNYIRDAFPIFTSSFIETFKQESIVLLTGLLFGMKEVAIVDLAKKILSMPRIILGNINVAIYPKLRLNPTVKNIKRILKYEWLIGFILISSLVTLGYPIILLLGGNGMTDAYPILIILSFTILSWLIVGAYNYHIFIPQKQNLTITKTQFVSLIGFIVLLIPNFIYSPNLQMIVLALSISSIIEIIYATQIIKKEKLLD